MRDYEAKAAPDLKSAGLSGHPHANDITASDRTEFGAQSTRSVFPNGSEGYHSAALGRFSTLQPSGASRYVLQLQRQFGNHYVQQVIALARSETDEQEITPNVESVIERKRGSGQPLDDGLRAQMESAFGSDFRGVRVHTDTEAGALNRAVNAVAFTTGQDIFFGYGAYNPESSAGRELLSHELTHVVQQGGNTVQSKLVLGDPEGRYEQEADEVARQVASNHAVNAPPQRSSPLLLQRSPSRNPGLTVTPILDPDPAAPSKAQPPKVAWVSKQRQTVDGEQIPDAERMRVGELLIVRVSLDHVEPAALRSMGSVFITDALTKESFAVEDTGVIQINFRATKIGAEHAEMRFTPAGTAASDQVSIPVETHVEMSQEAFRGQLQEAELYANNAYHAALRYMRKVSPPYREGWEKVRKTLEEAGEGNPFNEIVIHLAITFLSGLAGGKVLEVMEDLKVGKPLTEGLKELTIHATEAGLHAAMPPKASASLPQDPSDWVDACEEQIETEQLAVGTMLEDLSKANNDNRAGFFRDFDVVAAVHNALTFNGQPMRSLETTAIPRAEDFERMIWKGWLGAYHGIPDISDADAWIVITNRLDDLGEDSWHFLRTYMK
jgi:hypothetical protein